MSEAKKDEKYLLSVGQPEDDDFDVAVADDGVEAFSMLLAATMPKQAD